MPPFPLGLALATTAGIAGAAQIAAIQSQNFPGRRFGGSVKAGGVYNFLEGGDAELLKIGNRTILAMGNKDGMVTPSRVARDTVSGGTAPNVKIEIINQAGVKVTPDVSTGPDGALLARFVLSTIERDFAEEGRAYRTLKAKTGMRTLPR